jgi:cyclase
MPTRRDFLTTASLAATGMAFALRTGLPPGAYVRALAQAPQTPTSFEQLRGNIGIFTGRGGTIGWYVAPAGVIAIDAQFPDMAAIFLGKLNEKSGNRPVDVLFNTHHHGDHTAGNVAFKGVAKKIVAHARVPELQRMAAERAAAQQQAAAEQVYADTTFSDEWSIAMGDEKVVARYYGPAHTGGDSVVFFERANVAHMGDLVFNRRHPFIDKPGGASIAGWITTLERVAGDRPDTLFIFGHNKEGWKASGGKDELLYQRDYLSALLDHVRGEITAGRSRDEIVKSTSELKGFPEHGPLVERVLAPAYEELTA